MEPKYNKIIEPFAGSARYALKYFEHEVTIVDKFDRVIQLWKWLQQCTPSDILRLPIMKTGEKIAEYNLSNDEANFMRFLVQVGSHGYCKTVSPRGAKSFERQIKNVSEQLHKIRHWKIIHGDYLDLDNETCTWFIDPPYQFGGHSYKESNKNIDFDKLGEWVKSRHGQVICCENTKADWLPFKRLKKIHGSRGFTLEAVWYDSFK